MKKEGFAELLAQYVESRRRQPFVWGVNDCVLCAADGLVMIRGDDLLGDLRGRWNDALSAARVLREVGGLVAAVDRLPIKRRPNTFVQRGDLCLVTMGDRESLGICNGERIAGPGDREMLFAPMDDLLMAWET